MRNSLGASFLRLHRLDEAHQMLSEGVQVNSANGERQLLVHSLLTLTRVLLAQDRFDQAKGSCAQALGVATDLPDETLAGAARRLQDDVERAALHAAGRAEHPLL